MVVGGGSGGLGGVVVVILVAVTGVPLKFRENIFRAIIM